MSLEITQVRIIFDALLMSFKISPVILRNADDKVYYYNKITQASSWTEPEELVKAKKEAERIDAAQGGNMMGGGAPQAGGMNPAMMQMMMMMMMNNKSGKEGNKKDKNKECYKAYLVILFSVVVFPVQILC